MYSRLLSSRRPLAALLLFLRVYHYNFRVVAPNFMMSSRRSARLSSGRIPVKEEQNGEVDSGKAQSESLKVPKPAGKLGRAKKAVANIVAKAVGSNQKDGLLPPKAGRVTKRKAVKEEETEAGAPQTPKKKSKVSSANAPVTPMAGADDANGNSTPKKKARPRRVDPHATNAPLQTPGGSRVIKKYPSDLFEMTTPQAFRADFTTTENLLEKSCEHLCSVDPKLRIVIDKHPCKLFSPEGLQEEVDPFVALTSSIISQQVCNIGQSL